MTDPAAPRGRRLGKVTGLPLIVQLIGLLVGALVAAQLVTLMLALLLPPATAPRYALSDIAAALRGDADTDRRFDRTIQSGPPDLSTQGWFVSTSARAKLASLLSRPLGEVALGFYTQLPVGGTVAPVGAPSRLPHDAERIPAERIGAVDSGFDGQGGLPDGDAPRFLPAAFFQQMPGPPPGGGFPGGGMPGDRMPGGRSPDSFPRTPTTGTHIPQARAPQQQSPRQQRQPDTQQQQQQQQQQAETPTQVPNRTDASPPGTPDGRSPVPPTAPGPERNQGPPRGEGMPPADTPPSGLTIPRRTDTVAPRPLPPVEPPRAAPAPLADVVREPARTDRAPDTPIADAQPEAEAATAETSASPTVETPFYPPPRGTPVPIVRPARGPFDIAPTRFVEGDFVAGVQMVDGRWAVVSPRSEGFPNAWQRRIALWFLLSLLAVAPIAWLFARRIVGPLNDFAHAADELGRHPDATVLPLDGPAEIGRAAHAFNQMQSRLRAFVDDRTAMIGAISHDLRTPLTRLRFRIEDVPDDQQDGLRGEVDEMEEMIASVIAFMRDSSTPAARERRDLRDIVDDVIEDAALLGDVTSAGTDRAIVDIDPLGIRRVLDNLIMNAIKYGGRSVRVSLRIEGGSAIVDVLDDGLGVPDDELERIFEPFYRSEAARHSNRDGSGLGLAVCRSIARAHGGDVALFHSADGFIARLVIPSTFDSRAAIN